MKYLTKEMIVRINHKSLLAHGGNFIQPSNFLNEQNLDYWLEAAESDMFGQLLYPLLSDKAGLMMYSIIANHIFQDGNKRTRLEAAILFLAMNGHRIAKDLPKDNVYNFTIKVASGLSSLVAYQIGFETYTVKAYL